jgi:hypothetical protein
MEKWQIVTLNLPLAIRRVRKRHSPHGAPQFGEGGLGRPPSA